MTRWRGSVFQNRSSNMIERIIFMHDFSIIFMFSILFIVIYFFFFSYLSGFYRFSFYEHHTLETVWTLIPFFVLSLLIVPSLASLYVLDSCFFCGVIVKIVGHQWYWSYFTGNGERYSSLDSYMLRDGVLRLLDVDNRLIVPLITPLRFILTSADVIHSWTIPSFGIKMDAVPGRLNQFCTLANRSGVYFGQCSEICGANHRFMPIVMEVSLKR